MHAMLDDFAGGEDGMATDRGGDTYGTEGDEKAQGKAGKAVDTRGGVAGWSVQAAVIMATGLLGRGHTILDLWPLANVGCVEQWVLSWIWLHGLRFGRFRLKLHVSLGS